MNIIYNIESIVLAYSGTCFQWSCSANCKKEIDDYDFYFQKVVSNKNDTACIPPFWKKKLRGVLELKDCTTQKQLKGIYTYIKNYGALLANDTVPCIDMYNAVAWNWNARQGKNDSKQAIIKIYWSFDLTKEKCSNSLI